MEHITVKATTVATDQELGTFTAIVSAWAPDREQDVIARTAFDRTINAWRQSGKHLPLLFEHSTEEIGRVDPHSMRPTEDGLVVAGEVDRATDKGQQVWRQIKRGTAGFSIGFMASSRPRKGGGRELTEIDLLEISATSTPAHPATRALDWKSATGHDPGFDDVRAEARDHMVRLLTELDGKTLRDDETPSHTELQRQLVREGIISRPASSDLDEHDEKSVAPVNIATFEC
jgi:HK97 family phage prohead protease